MRRLKPHIKEKKSLQRFELRVSKINTKLMWNSCSWCDCEFRREDGYMIIMQENHNIDNPTEYYYVCNKCSKGISIEEMKKVWEEGNLYKTFQRRTHDE